MPMSQSHKLTCSGHMLCISCPFTCIWCDAPCTVKRCKLILSNGTITKESCNWIYFISVVPCQMTPLKFWLHTGRGCNHQLCARPSYNLDVRLLWYPNPQPWGQGWRLRSALRPRSNLVIWCTTLDSNPHFTGEKQKSYSWSPVSLKISEQILNSLIDGR